MLMMRDMSWAISAWKAKVSTSSAMVMDCLIYEVVNGFETELFAVDDDEKLLSAAIDWSFIFCSLSILRYGCNENNIS